MPAQPLFLLCALVVGPNQPAPWNTRRREGGTFLAGGRGCTCRGCLAQPLAIISCRAARHALTSRFATYPRVTSQFNSVPKHCPIPLRFRIAPGRRRRKPQGSRARCVARPLESPAHRFPATRVAAAVAALARPGLIGRGGLKGDMLRMQQQTLARPVFNTAPAACAASFEALLRRSTTCELLHCTAVWAPPGSHPPHLWGPFVYPSPPRAPGLSACSGRRALHLPSAPGRAGPWCPAAPASTCAMARWCCSWRRSCNPGLRVSVPARRGEGVSQQ